ARNPLGATEDFFELIFGEFREFCFLAIDVYDLNRHTTTTFPPGSTLLAPYIYLGSDERAPFRGINIYLGHVISSPSEEHSVTTKWRETTKAGGEELCHRPSPVTSPYEILRLRGAVMCRVPETAGKDEMRRDELIVSEDPVTGKPFHAPILLHHQKTMSVIYEELVQGIGASPIYLSNPVLKSSFPTPDICPTPCIHYIKSEHLVPIIYSLSGRF
ncbi:unnamed protein product, partial [Allacma fusca]